MQSKLNCINYSALLPRVVQDDNVVYCGSDWHSMTNTVRKLSQQKSFILLRRQ